MWELHEAGVSNTLMTLALDTLLGLKIVRHFRLPGSMGTVTFLHT